MTTNYNRRICKDPNSLEDENHLLQCVIFKEENGEKTFIDVNNNEEKKLIQCVFLVL